MVVIPKIDLTGKRFGCLTVICDTGKRVQRKVVWECICDCGNTCTVLSTNLTTGRTSSCGCKRYEIIADHYRDKCPKNGDIVNGTKVLDYQYIPNYRGNNDCYLLCECKFCGNHFWVKQTLLKSGNTKSCGCIKKSTGEKTIEKILISNNIQFEREKTFDDCYDTKKFAKCRFDFYVDKKYLIEYDGPQHYKYYNYKSAWFSPQTISTIQRRDQYKNDWCISNDIPLIRIPYYALSTLTIDDLQIETSKYLINKKRNEMIDIFKHEDNWQDIKDSTMNTIGKTTGSYPTSEWKWNLLISEHSPIRRMKFYWRWKELKSWVSVHMVRHKVGIEHWVTTQRTDRTGVNRDELPQGSLVNHACEADAQALINISRKRLCSCASPETRMAWQAVKDEVAKVEPELAECMVRECVYRGFCPEMFPCGYTKTEQYQEDLLLYRKGRV